MIDEFLAKRRRNAEILTDGVNGVSGLEPQRTGRGVEHSYSYYTVVMSLDQYKCSRDEFIEALQAENVGCMVYYPVPLTKQPALRSFAIKASCPVAEETSEKVFSIPVHPSLTDQDLSNIIRALEKVSDHFLK